MLIRSRTKSVYKGRQLGPAFVYFPLHSRSSSSTVSGCQIENAGHLLVGMFIALEGPSTIRGEGYS